MLRRHRASAPQAPSGPHRFVELPDPRLGMAFGAGVNEGQLSPSAGLLVAGVTVRPQRCAMSGCGRPRDDPIHWPAG